MVAFSLTFHRPIETADYLYKLELIGVDKMLRVVPEWSEWGAWVPGTPVWRCWPRPGWRTACLWTSPVKDDDYPQLAFLSRANRAWKGCKKSFIIFKTQTVLIFFVWRVMSLPQIFRRFYKIRFENENPTGKNGSRVDKSVETKLKR